MSSGPFAHRFRPAEDGGGFICRVCGLHVDVLGTSISGCPPEVDWAALDRVQALTDERTARDAAREIHRIGKGGTR